MKDSLIPYVSKLKSAKEIYEKLVELFSEYCRRSNLFETRTIQNEIVKARRNHSILYEDY